MSSTADAGPRAVIFDLDNTAYAYDPCHREGLATAWRTARERFSAWEDRESFERAYAEARREVQQRLGRQAATHSRTLYFLTLWSRQASVSAAGVLALENAYWRGYFTAMKVDPLCLPTFEALRARGIPTAWMTNFTTERQLQKLQALGLGEAADVLVSSEEAGVEKPDPSILDLTLSRLGSRPEDTWLVGDSWTADGGVAATRGLVFLWLRWPNTDSSSARAPAPEDPRIRTVSSWREIRRELGLET